MSVCVGMSHIHMHQHSPTVVESQLAVCWTSFIMKLTDNRAIIGGSVYRNGNLIDTNLYAKVLPDYMQINDINEKNVEFNPNCSNKPV